MSFYLEQLTHVKKRRIGRKEIAMFFQLYLVTIFLEMLLVTNIIPTASILYPVRKERWKKFD